MSSSAPPPSAPEPERADAQSTAREPADAGAEESAPPAVPRRSPATARWSRQLGWLLANLTVVFAGVYAAFTLERIQAEERQRERAAAFARALAREFASTAESLAAEGSGMEQEFVRPFLDALDAGRRPRLRLTPYAVGEVEPGLWRALMAAGGLETLAPDTILEIDGFYATLSSVVENLDRFEQLCNDHLIPQLDAPLDTFYDDSGALRPSWSWYEQSLRHLPESVTRLESWARSLSERLQALAPEPPS